MSTEKATVQTTRMGQVALTQFFGGKEDGRCVQLTCKGSSADGFQVVQFTKADAVAMAAALNEWAADVRDDA